MTTSIRELFENTTHALNANQIEQAAVQDGMLTIMQKGMLKVIAGETTLEEIYRVIG